MTVTLPTPPPPDDATAAPSPRRKRRGRRFLLALLLLVLGVAGAHGLWGYRTSSRLASRLAPYRAAGEPLTAGELAAWPAIRRDGDNVVMPLREATALLKPKTPAWVAAFEDYGMNPKPPLLPEEVAALEKVLAENAEALAASEAVLGKGGVDWQPAFKAPLIDWALAQDELASLRSLTDVLWASALLEHHWGNDAITLRRAEQLLHVSDAAGHGPSILSYFISLGIAQHAHKIVAESAPGLRVAAGEAGPGDGRPGDPAATGPATRTQVRRVIGLMLDERAVKEGQRRAWIGERVVQLDTMEALSRGKLAANAIVVRPGEPRPAPPAGLHLLLRPYYRDNAVAIAAHTTDVMRATAESPDLPAFNATLAKAGTPVFRRSRWRYQMANVLLPTMERAAQQHYYGLMNRRLAATALACRLYALEHDGQLPAKLEDLVPDYLPAVPLDPMAEGGKPLRYVDPEKDPEKPRVYSVGENGIDHGGNEPDPRLPRRDRDPVSDEVRHLKRQPRSEPPQTPLSAGTVSDEPADETPPEAAEPGNAPECGP